MSNKKIKATSKVKLNVAFNMVGAGGFEPPKH